jgi:acyl carrier protein
MTSQDVTQQLRRFLGERLKIDLADEDPIFAPGRVNSLFAMQLVLFVEKQFGISVDSDDLDMKNFATIASIARLVARKNGTA